jgi:AbiV family abortive infection protein
MRPRAIADLTQLADPEFIDQISLGMRAVLENARVLVEDARLLWDAQRYRAADLLLRIAEEEAAKYHILLDAVRCPRAGSTLPRQLKRFNDHLAKGLYAEYVWIAPATYGEVLEFLEGHRRTLYLDGPNDIDWVFRNSILREREESLYVDYVDDGGKHSWVEPRPPRTASWGFVEPRSASLANRLSAAGFDSPAALATIAELWREIQFNADDHWLSCHEINLRTLTTLDSQRLLTPEGKADAGHIAWHWLFPLHSADLRPIEVTRKDLEAVQREWFPEY